MEDVKRLPGRRSTLRAERAEVTRRRIADAARRLFFRDGYAATTIQSIAAEAGVAVQTVYAVYGSKAGILDVLRQGVMSQPEAVASFAAATNEPSLGPRLDHFARSIRQRWDLAGDVVAIARDASMTDPAVRAGVEETLQIRRRGILAFAETLAAGLRPGMDVSAAAAIVDALTLPEVYAELVGVQGWTPDAYEAWLSGALRRELLAAPGGR